MDSRDAARAKRLITYSEFIGELRRLAFDGTRIRIHKRMHLDPEFRVWRNELESLVRQIQQQGYVLPSPFNSPMRGYGGRGRLTETDEELFAQYQRHMDDTLIEVRAIVKNFEGFGPPAKNTQGTALASPEKVTFAWLWHHVRVTQWIAFAAFIAGVFAAGYATGRNDYINRLLQFVVSEQPVKGAK